MKNNTKKILIASSILSLSLFLATPCLNVQANDFGNIEDYQVPYSQVVPFSTTIAYNYAEYPAMVPLVFVYDDYKTLADKYDNGYYEYVVPGDNLDIFSLNISKGEEDLSSSYYSELTTAQLYIDLYNDNASRLTPQIIGLEFFFTNIFVDKTFFTGNTLFLIQFDFPVDYSFELMGRYSYIQNNQPVLDGILLYDRVQDNGQFFISLSMFENQGVEDAIYIYDLSLEITFDVPYYNINNESAAISIYTYYMPQDLIPSFPLFSSLIIGGGFVDLSGFLESSIGGFLSFEIAPGFSIYIILGVVFGLSLLFAILKIYFGG